MKLIKKITCFCLLTVNIILGWSQDITFNHLSTDEGLSQVSVVTLYKDERGFIWIGTRDGLNCYNSNGIKIFKLQKNNPNSLFSNSILRIEGNQNGKIYLQCAEGVAEYDFKKDGFTTLLQGDVSAIYYNKQLYIARDNTIQVYDEENRRFKTYYELPDKRLIISCLYQTGNTLWIGTANKGLFVLNNKTSLKQVLPKGNISRIYGDSSGQLWVGSWENGLYRIKGSVITNYRNEPGNDRSLSSDFVRACCEDNQGNIWVGTFNGLCKYNSKTNDFYTYQPNNKPNSLSHSSVWSIIKDQQGTIWLGTFFGGVNYFNPEYDIYTRYRPSSVESEGLSSPIVGRMIEDKHNNLWICTEGGGLNMYNRSTKTFKWYRHSAGSNSISHNNVKAVYYDANHEVMWIGTHLGGLNKLDLKSGKFTYYLSNSDDPTTLPSDIVRDILPYRDQLIVATENGVCLFNPATGKCRQLFREFKEGRYIQKVADLLFDYRGTLWMAVTGQGAFSYRFDTNKLTNYKHNHAIQSSISNNNINSIFQDSRHNLWFCTSGGGLDLYRYKSDDFENYDALNNGLSGDCVYEACESTQGNLLVITNQGFSRFDCSKKIFYNYNRENGFPLTAINENALCLTRDGEVFLGGVKGMISFKVKDLNFSPKPYKIIPYRLFVNGNEVAVNDETGILKSSLSSSSGIILKSKYNVFSIEFATSNFIPSNQNEVVYKLEGFSERWTNTRGQHTITYTNLNPGKYTLVIKAKDASGLKIPESRLDIEVLPPFYRTTIAYLFYIFIIGLMIYYFLRAYNSRIKLQESLKYEQKHIQDVEKLNQSKLRFFTNISHEFRTPLTLIIGQMEMLLQAQSFTPTIYNKILGVYKNSLHLRELITELLDFRKHEEGHMKIKVAEQNIVDFLYENYLLFLEYANARQIAFKFNKETGALNVWYDSKQLQKVINNLLSNAFKHTPVGGYISISIKQINDEAVISVTDSGTGINSENIDKIFDSFYQADENRAVAYAGTGIGLALAKGIVELHHGKISVSSEPGMGATFTIRLKLGNGHFGAKEICEVEDMIKEGVEPVITESNLMPEEVALVSEIDKSKGFRMLIVEDNHSLREMLINIFEPFYEVISAADGEEGLEKVKSESPNIVLSDVLMPKMSGTELCKRIKDDIDTCHIPVVLLTARTAIEHNLEGLRIGADDYITKPFNIKILVSRCNNLVNSRMILQEKFSKQPQVTPQMLATNTLDKALLDKAMEIIEKSLDDTEFNINIFAREMGMSRTNLFAKIKAITGQTPNDFISMVRLKKAAILLRNNPELNITEISDQLGFSSSRYFSKCFKDQYHVSPLSYRKGVSSDEEDEETNNVQ